MVALEIDNKLSNKEILSLLSNFRYLFKDISNNENNILKKICSFLPSKHMVFPCDIIDLRKFLFNKQIEFYKYVPLFSQRFAEKFLKRYPIFLVIEINKIDTEVFKYGGLCIALSEKIDISNSLVRITINEPTINNAFNVVGKIINDLGEEIECIISNSIPGISGYDPKLSSNTGQINNNIFSGFKKNKKGNKMNNNWYNDIKKSQIIEPRAVPITREDAEVIKGPKKMNPQYYRGMRVRDRRKGMANPQEFGIIDSISDNILTITWNPDKKDKKDKKRKEKFDMVEDTEILALIVAEV